MVLGLLKWLKETRFYKSKKKIITKHALCIQRRTLVERRNLHVLRNEKVMFQSLKEQKKRKDIFFSMEHSLLVAKELLF